MGSMLSKAQEELIIEAAGSDGRVILLFDEDESGRKGRAEARYRLARSVTVNAVKLDAEGMQPDQLSPANLLELLQ